MKASKLIVLVGGVLGIVAFFLPLVSVHREDTTVTLSAFQLVRGGDTVNVSVNQGGHKSTVGVDTKPETSSDMDMDKIKSVMMGVFVPAFLIALIGIVGLVRGKFGRIAGILSLLLGLLGLGVGAIMHAAAEGDGGIGITLLLVTGACGALGGLLALISPDRGAGATA